jgi:hypothetical protein
MASPSQTQRRYNAAMERQQAFQFALRENGEQRRQMRRYAGSVRFVYNHALALQQEMYERTGKSHTTGDQALLVLFMLAAANGICLTKREIQGTLSPANRPGIPFLAPELPGRPETFNKIGNDPLSRIASMLFAKTDRGSDACNSQVHSVSPLFVPEKRPPCLL